jgi:hypothetical protein
MIDGLPDPQRDELEHDSQILAKFLRKELPASTSYVLILFNDAGAVKMISDVEKEEYVTSLRRLMVAIGEIETVSQPQGEQQLELDRLRTYLSRSQSLSVDELPASIVDAAMKQISWLRQRYAMDVPQGRKMIPDPRP